jgi:hypothetical protein
MMILAETEKGNRGTGCFINLKYKSCHDAKKIRRYDSLII